MQHPDGPGLLADSWVAFGRCLAEIRKANADEPLDEAAEFSGARQQILRDDRAREVCCLLADISGGIPTAPLIVAGLKELPVQSPEGEDFGERTPRDDDGLR